MATTSGSIALFSLSLAGLRAADVNSPKALSSIKALSAIVLALVAWDPERVHYCAQVTSVATGAMLYAQLPSIVAGVAELAGNSRSSCRKRHECRHQETREHKRKHRESRSVHD